MQDVHHYDKWFSSNSFGKTANELWKNGYSFDYISDRQISDIATDRLNNVFLSPTSKYQVIVVPAIDFIPKETLDKLNQLAERGVKVIFSEKNPKNYSGLLATRSSLKPSLSDEIVVSNEILETLNSFQVPKEIFNENELQFIRKKNKDGTLYFVANLSSKAFADTIRLSSDYSYLTIYNPLTNTTEYIESKDLFKFKILPGETYFIQTLKKRPEVDAQYLIEPYDTLYLNQEWKVSFEKGEEQGIQDQYSIDTLTSWTTWGDENLVSYMGKAKYVYTFKNMEEELSSTQKYTLEFDRIRESAEILINGKSYGTIWSFPAQLDLPAGIFQESNRIEIIVQNLSSNYMTVYDKKHPDWKKFYDINFVDITYTPFEASKWPIEPSGLIGGVRLVKYR
jgi:hypothetical protein